MADEKTEISSLYNIAIEVVLQQRISEKNDNLNVHHLPDRVIHDLLAECLSFVPKSNNLNKSEKPVRKYSVRKLRIFFNKITLNVWVRLLRHEAYRKTLVQFYQRLYNYDSNECARGSEARVNEVIIKSFQELTFERDLDVREREANFKNGFVESFQELTLESYLLKHIDHGLILGSFFSETSWYDVSKEILKYVIQLCHKLPENHITTYISQLECYQRLFHTYSMFFKFDEAAVIKDEIEKLRTRLKQSKHEVNYALLFTEYSRYSFLKSNYEESQEWIQRAMKELHEKLTVSVIVDVLRQASKVCVVKRDFDKAKDLIYQALGRAYQHYGHGSHKLATLLPDFGFYLLYSDQIESCVTVYREAYSLRRKTFDHSNNLLVAIAEEDLAYALYVKEYSSGEFDLAMKHAEQAISTMKKLLPPGNLMLASANRVKALILEELAIDTYTNQEDGLVNMDMLEEAERLHKDALKLTKHTFGEENILTAKHYGNLGRLYQSMRKYEEAENMHLKAIRIKEKILGGNDYEVGLSVGHLASLYNYHMQKYEQAEVLYRRSININLKLFSEAYSGLEYDYRGLIHVYEKLSDDEKYLKYTHKLHRWSDLRKSHTSESISSNFYENIKIKPLEEIVNMYHVDISSICQDRESSQSGNLIENIGRF